MGYDIVHTVDIAAAPDAVRRWTVVEPNLERSGRNLDGKGVQTLERLDEGPVRVGTRFRGTVKTSSRPPWAQPRRGQVG